jgi:hypothetical protein
MTPLSLNVCAILLNRRARYFAAVQRFTSKSQERKFMGFEQVSINDLPPKLLARIP